MELIALNEPKELETTPLSHENYIKRLKSFKVNPIPCIQTINIFNRLRILFL